MATDILAVDGRTAVVRAEVRYGDPARQEYRDLWVIRFADEDRCTWSEERPYRPGLADSATDEARRDVYYPHAVGRPGLAARIRWPREAAVSTASEF